MSTRRCSRGLRGAANGLARSGLGASIGGSIAASIAATVVAACAGCGGGAATQAPPVGASAETQPSRGVLTRTSERAHDRRALDDTDVAGAVQQRIARDESIPPNAVLVSAEDGVVTLSGTLPSLVAAERAREIAERTRGVLRVVMRLDTIAAARDDEAIRTDLEHAIEWDAELGSREVDVSVERGRVTLEGRVGSLSERRLASALARRVRGVSAVINSLDVAPTTPRSDHEIAEELRAALAREARIDPGAIQLTVERGRATLSGAVGSAAERELARELAERAGATQVDVEALDVRWWARDQMRRPREAAPPSDAQIAAEVREAVAHDPRVDASSVSAGVERGVATLRGVVPSAAARDAAIADALATTGVWRVVDELEVDPRAPVDDEALVERVSARLAAGAATAGAPIEVSAEQGVVTLRGAVRSRDRIREAVFAATRLAGVRRVENRLALDASWEPLDDWELTTEIREGLAWSPFLDRIAVRVDVADGIATLRGDVDDLRAYREAEREAYEAGAAEVRNELTVDGQRVGATRAPTPAPRR